MVEKKWAIKRTGRTEPKQRAPSLRSRTLERRKRDLVGLVTQGVLSGGEWRYDVSESLPGNHDIPDGCFYPLESAMNPLRLKENRMFDPLRENPAIDPFFRMYIRLAVLFRRANAKNRVLPDFLVVGAPKSGTTSLFHYLAQHPQILPSIYKEVHFFNNHYEKSVLWYRAHFPLRSQLADNCITGEASPAYLSNPIVPERIRQVCPRSKLIMILRNPTDRAISHYFHIKKQKPDCNLSIEDCLAREDAELLPLGRNKYLPKGAWFFSLKYRGLYAKQLQRYLALFPREQMHIIISERMFDDPAKEVKKVLAFLGVEDAFLPQDLKPRNVSRFRKDVSPEIYDKLDKYFAPHNAKLAELLGEELPW